MAQLNITLNQEEILQLLTAGEDEKNDAFRKILECCVNSILKAESAAQLNAEKYERTDERSDFRNGSRERQMTTRIGKINLVIPRHRNVPFKTLLFDNYTRSEAALITTMAEMVVCGVSTRKVSKVVETLCGQTYSKSMVSEVCKSLDKQVETFRNRPLEGDYPFLLVDATYLKVRENGRIVAKAFMVAVATKEDGKREIVGFDVLENESNDTWLKFMESLKNRGLKGLQMITSDAHNGILYAINRTYPTVAWQRCQTHFSRNILEKTPAKYKVGLRAELLEMYNARTSKAARIIRDRIISDYQDIAPAAMKCLDEGFESVITVMVLPENIRRFHRTSNHIERLNREIKRRSDVIGIFPNPESIIRIIGSVLMEEDQKFSKGRNTGYPKSIVQAMAICSKDLQKIAVEQQKLYAA